MLTKIIKSSLLLRQTQLSCFGFGSYNNQGKGEPEEEIIETRINPLKIKDLRGYENFDALSDDEKSYSPVLPQTYQKASLYSIFSRFPYLRYYG